MSLQSKARAPFLSLCLVSAISALHGQELQAPAPAHPVISSKKSSDAAASSIAAAPLLFSIGEPSDDEQLYLELINRARANPSAEAQRLITLNDIYVRNALQKVNTNMLVQQFSTNQPAAPLSFNSKLINAARAHT